MAHILLIESDSRMASLLEGSLVEAGHRSTWLRHGGRVVQVVGSAAFDAVVTSIFLPEVDGLEVIQKLRQSHPRLPVVAMCEEPSQGYLSLAGRLGAKATLRKPFVPHELVETLAAVLGNQEARRA